MEGSGEFVLVDLGGSLQPEEDLDIEPGVIEGDQLGLAEPGFALERLIVVEEELADQLVHIHVAGRRGFFNSGPGKLRERF